MTSSANFILSQLSSASLARVTPHLSVTHLAATQVLVQSRGVVSRVYFPHSGIISCVVGLIGGAAIETGMIGKDGVFGASQALGGAVSLNAINVQIPGTASVMAADKLRMLVAELPDFRDLLLRYEQFFLAQVQQTAACNAVHDIEQRTCRWLARMHDLAGPDLTLTQEFFAEMMGVRRTSITGVASALQARGMISYRRGRLHITDIEAVRERACECNEGVREHYRAMFDQDPADMRAGG